MSDTNSETKNKLCYNCNYSFGPDENFCGSCGQKYTTGKIEFGQLLNDFVANYFNIDSKIFTTFFALLVPGKLTLEYFKGRHKSFFHPIRLFLFCLVIFLATVSQYGNDGFFQFEIEKGDDENTLVKYNTTTKLINELDSVKNKLALSYQDKDAMAISDSLLQFLKQKTKINDTISFNQDMVFSTHDFFELESKDLIEKYNIQPLWQKIVATQIKKIMIVGQGGFSSFIFAKLSWMTILMMPVLALILKLMYISIKRFYVEHLIFSFHYHSFTFILLSLLQISGYYLNINFLPFGIICISIYLTLAMKNVYQQSWVKTIFKFFFLNFAYMFLFAFFLFATFAIGFLLI